MPSWLSDLVGTDMAPLAYYALVAAIVLALIVIVLAVAKKAMGISSGPKVKGRGPRLAVLDVSVIDPKRKLVLVRRDEVEHLLLIGGQNDLVVEGGISRSAVRPARVEPTIGAEAAYGQGAARAAVPGRGSPARGASPLTRPVPRSSQPVAPAESQTSDVPPVVSPAPDRSEPVLDVPRPPAPVVASPAVTPPAAAAPIAAPPVAVPSSDGETADTGMSGIVAGPRPGAPVVEPISSNEIAPPRATTPAASAPLARAPVPSAAPSSNEAPKTFAPVPSPVPSVRSAPAQVAPPVVASPAALPPVVPQREAQQPARAPQIAASAMPRPIQREPEQAAKPMEPAPSQELQKAGVPVLPPRFSIGGSLEPVQRSGPSTSLPPAQPLQPFQPRSMATPTLPPKPTPAAAELEAKISRPEPAKGEFSEPSDDADDTVAEKPVSPEPSPEEVLARLLAKAKEPVHPAGDRMASASLEKRQVAPAVTVPSQTSAAPLPKSEPIPAETELTGPSVEATDAGDRRPLSVRSFASAIQGRQALPEASATPQTRRDPEVAIPATPPPVAPPREQAAIAPAAQTRPPATSWEDEEDDLGEFLSAQLNDDLGEDIWATKETNPPAPPVAVEPKKPAAPVEPPADGPRATAPAKRPLTLEEEMERLLGDFDLETSDRRVR